MNKVEMVKKIAEVTGHTQKDVGAILTAFQDTVKEAVGKGEKVAMAGFMTFEKKHVDAKKGTSHLHGVEKEWSTPAKDEVAVKLSKGYKEL